MAACKDFSRSVVGGSDEVKDILCEPCEQDGRQTEAEGFCVDCSEYLCRQCYKNHKLFKAFRNHVLQDKGNIPQSVTAVVKDTCLTKCDLHSEKVIEYFCGSCDKLGCTTCITLDHRQCEKVEHIPKIVKLPKIDEEFQTLFKRVNFISKQVQERKNALKPMSGTTDNMRKMAKTELKNQRAELIKFFDDLEKEMDTKIEEIHASNTATLTAASETYDTMDKDLSDVKGDIGTKHNAGQHCEAFIAMKHSATDIDAIEKQFQSLQTESKILKYKLLPSSQIQDMKKKITALCRLETETVLMDPNVIQATDKQPALIATLPLKVEDTTEKTSKRPDLSTSKFLKLNTEINICTSNDEETSYVIGLTLVHEHYIVVVDRPNKAVKVIDLRNKKVTSELVMEKTVWSVTKVNDDKIVVGMQPSIQFLTVSKSGILSKDLAFDSNMTSFAVVFSKEKLILAQGSCIEIMNMQGKVLKTIDYNSEGKPLFTSCYGLAISEDQETIYVSDNNKNTVTSMTLDGKVKDIYRDNALKNPWGITVDSEGNVYVCSSSTKSIHQLSPDCKKLQVFQDIQGQCITCTNTKKLLVGSHQGLRIYDLMSK